MLGHQKFSQFLLLSVLGDEEMILMLLLYASLTLDQRIFQPIYIQWDCCIFSLAFVPNSHHSIPSFTGGEKRSATAPLQISMFCIPLLWLLWTHCSQCPSFVQKLIFDEKVTFLVLFWIEIWNFEMIKKKNFLGWLTFYRLGWVEFYRYQKFKVSFAKMYFLTKNGLLP